MSCSAADITVISATLHDTVKGSNINSFIVFAPFLGFVGTCKNDSLRKGVQTKPEKHERFAQLRI